MTLVHAIGRVLVCLFIVGGYGAGDIALAQKVPDKDQVKQGIKLVEVFVGFVRDAFKPGRYLRVGTVLDTESNVKGTIEFEELKREGSVTTKNSGPGVSIVSGYTMGFGGYEFDFSYRNNEIEHFKFDQLDSQTTVDGNLETFALMLNFVYEFKIDPLESKGIRPYLIGGGGGSYVRYTEKRLLGSLGLKSEDTSEHMQDKGHFAYQGGAGVRWELPFFEGFNVDVSYRYLGTPEIKFKPIKEGSERSVKFDNTRQTVMLGLTFVF